MKQSRSVAFQVGPRIVLVVFIFLAVWSGVYWLSAFLRHDISAAAVSYGIHLLTLFLSLCSFIGGATVVARLLRRPQLDVFVALTEAMKRIGSGDFSVNVQLEQRQSSFYHEVASNLNQMAESLKQLERMRQEFISDVSHEIQSPLTSIAGFARALHDKGLSGVKRDEYLDIIESESRRLSRLSDGLLKLSSLESKVQPVNPRNYRLDEQLRSITLSYEPQWSEKAIELEAEMESVSIFADEEMMGQVWGNLIQNAIKFTPPKGHILISLHHEGNSVVVNIKDSGIGIGSEDLPYVFERFYKADKSRTAANGASGSGLGLSIASKVVALHQGAIHAESAGLGKGSAFTVRLQIANPRDGRLG